jgi:cytochrome c oxidase cbb3-type subunit 3
MDDEPMPGDNPSVRIDTNAARWVVLGMLGLVVAGGVAYSMLRKPAPPPPPEVAADPVLSEGRTVYLTRCATCHGVDGRGDGPIAASLLGSPVGNISDGKWKHGSRPEDVTRVISQGVEGTRMAGWGLVLEPSQLRAVTAYVFYLAREPVPRALRKAGPPLPEMHLEH